MAPTRELAKQVGKEFESLNIKSDLKVYCIYGGMPYDPQGMLLLALPSKEQTIRILKIKP